MQQAVQQYQNRPRRYRRDSGFTIVELIIVIIVIAILALIVITTYNGVQQKARNTKTVAAVEAWVKALNLYYADIGAWPSPSCLGNTDTYDGDGKCWTGSNWAVTAAFLSSMNPYLGSGIPEPDTTVIDAPSGTSRGAVFYVNNNESNPLGPMIYFSQTSVNSCPEVGGLTLYSRTVKAGGVACLEQLRP